MGPTLALTLKMILVVCGGLFIVQHTVYERLTLAFEATVALARPLAFCLPFLLEGGAHRLTICTYHNKRS